jgi:hypothetical protein
VVDLGTLNEHTQEKMDLVIELAKLGFTDDQITEILVIAESNRKEKAYEITGKIQG